MANICSDDWYYSRPTEYFPDTDRYDRCDACGEFATVARGNMNDVAIAKNVQESIMSQCVGLSGECPNTPDANGYCWAHKEDR